MCRHVVASCLLAALTSALSASTAATPRVPDVTAQSSVISTADEPPNAPAGHHDVFRFKASDLAPGGACSGFLASRINSTSTVSIHAIPSTPSSSNSSMSSVPSMSSMSSMSSAASHALVLGCGGFIGSRLFQALRSRGATVSCIFNRSHVDIRNGSAFNAFMAALPRVDTIYFLAAEVGGFKFLTSPAAQRSILAHNAAMYATVFEYVAARPAVRCIFTSSYMRFSSGDAEIAPNAYSVAKATGEAWAATLPNARTVRLWNVYGMEALGGKSHVAADWAHSVVRNGRVVSVSNGRELRQWMHVADAAEAVAALGERWDETDAVTDVATGEWIPLRNVGRFMCCASVARGSSCELDFNGDAAPARVQVGPQQGRTFHAEWRRWMRPSSAAYDEVRMCVDDAVAEQRQMPEHGVGWVSLQCGIDRLLQQVEEAIADELER